MIGMRVKVESTEEKAVADAYVAKKVASGSATVYRRPSNTNPVQANQDRLANAEATGKLEGRFNPDLYDNTVGYDDETGVKVSSSLNPEETKQAVVLYRLFNELWGLCIVVGNPGTGKDLFGNILTHKIKRYFPWKRIWRDEKPRLLYGEYAGLFNDKVLSSELDKMKAVAVGKKGKEAEGQAIEDAAAKWVTGAGEVMLKNSVLYLTEFWRYCYNREPHAPMNKTMGAIHKVKRHLDCLILGTVQLPSELDKKTCLPWIDWKVTCSKSATNPTGYVYYVQKVFYDRRLDMLQGVGRPFPLAFDAGRPRTYLGDGKISVKKMDYKPQTEEERVVLKVLKAGAETYEEIISVLEAYGDMTEQETLTTLKNLKFNRRKRVIDYPCFFGLYNSKSAPQIKSSLKVDD